MKNIQKSAESELIQLLIRLKIDNKRLNTNEFISVLDRMKSVATNKELIDTAIKSVKVLAQAEIKHKGKLTKREKESLKFIGQGHKNTGIAKQLNLSKSTIETHRKNIRKKLMLNGSDNLFVYALLFSLQDHNLNSDDNS